MRILIIAAALLVIYFALRIMYQQTPKDFTRRFIKITGLGLLGLLILLAVTGRLHWLFALFGALLPWANRLLGFLPLFRVFQRFGQQRRFGQSRGGSARSAGQSGVSSHYFEMRLNHQDGSMDGEVLAGHYAGKTLSSLQVPELRELLAECMADNDSLSLLTAYLEYRFGSDWHVHIDIDPSQGGRHGEAGGRRASSQGSEMTRQEASEILGVQENAKKEEVVQAHRRLMQKFHPDRGGSDYLAAKINEAKETLLS